MQVSIKSDSKMFFFCRHTRRNAILEHDYLVLLLSEVVTKEWIDAEEGGNRATKRCKQERIMWRKFGLWLLYYNTSIPGKQTTLLTFVFYF